MMARHYFICCLLCIFFFLSLHAQKELSAQYHIKGVLLDSANHAVEPNIAIVVCIMQGSNKAVKLAMSNAHGEFNIPLSIPGLYILTFKGIGIRTMTKEVALTQFHPNAILGPIYVSEDIEELKGVTVEARRKLIKTDIDKLVYNVGIDPLASVSNAIEIMSRVPYISVNGLDEIKVLGQSSYNIYINGHPIGITSENIIQYLKSMPANTIQSIQVIVNPGVKYDANNNAAIINIVQAKVSKGYMLSLSEDFSNNITSENCFITLQTKKLNMTFHNSLSSRNFLKKFHSYRDRIVTNLRNGIAQDTHMDMYGRETHLPSAGLEIDYEPDTMKLLVANIEYEYNPSKSFQGHHIVQTDSLYQKIYSYNVDNNFHSTANNRVVQLAYQQKFKKEDEVLSFIFQNIHNEGFSSKYSDYNYMYDFTLPYMGTKTISRKNTDENAVQADISYPFQSVHYLNLGIKGTWRRNRDNYNFGKIATGGYEEDKSLSYDYTQHQDIYAAYIEYELQLKNWGLKGGIRYEYTHVKENGINRFSDSYGNFISSASMLYKINDTSQMRLVYDTYLSRPTFSEQNPHVNNTDPKNLYYGNPELKSSIDHDIRLFYDYFGNKFNFCTFLAFSFAFDQQEPYTFAVGNVLHHTYRNEGLTNNFIHNVHLSGPLTSFLDIETSVSWGFLWYHKTNDYPSQFRTFFGADSNLLCSLPRKWKLSLSYSQESALPSSQGKVSGNYSYSAKLFRSFFQNKLSVALYAKNFLETRLSTYSRVKVGAYCYDNESHSYAKLFGLSVRWRFGKLKRKAQEQINKITDDDLEKVKKLE